MDFNLRNVVGCLVSHEHKDHCKAIEDFISNGINVYASFGTFSNLERKKDAFWYSRFKQIKSEGQFELFGFTILPFEAQHDAAEPLGFLIQHEEVGKLLFITDSYYCQYNFTGLNHIMIECNYSEKILNKRLENEDIHPGQAKRLIKSHFSLENVKEFLKNTDLSQTREITLLHLSDGNSNAAEFKEEIEKLTGKPTYIADKGLEIELGGI